MDNAELGRRLKAARIAKKMTQREVVGDFITRNMLSQIESGAATPSMKTLEYLAGVLDLPMEKLLSDAAAETERTGMNTLQEAKQLVRDRSWEAVLALEDPSGLLADELHAIRCIAHLELAEKFARSEDTEQLQTAVYHARQAAIEAGQGIYSNAARAAEANRLIAQIAQHLSEYYSALAGSV